MSLRSNQGWALPGFADRKLTESREAIRKIQSATSERRSAVLSLQCTPGRKVRLGHAPCVRGVFVAGIRSEGMP